MSDIELTVRLPLDSDGFLRRECPTCEREFKWLLTTEAEEDAAVPSGAGYFCPYCQIQADSNHWHTRAQVEYAEQAIAPHAERVVAEEVQEGLRGLSGFKPSRLPSGPVPEPEPMSAEDDDMRRFDFACHPQEPVKVLDGWAGPVHCLLCGQAA